MIVAVERAGFLDAATSLRDANRAAADLHSRLADDLAVTAGMAGDDSTATEFAAAYDAAAGEALAGIADLTSACVTLGRLTEASWDNHADAETRSILPGRVVAQACTVAPEHGYVGVLAATPPSSLGGDSPLLSPHETWVLDHLEAFVWPDADVDRLRTAAGRWRAAAASLDLIATHAVRAAAAWDTQRSPEAVLAVAALDELRGTVDDLAASADAIGSHCDVYAGAVEQKRAEIVALVREILLMVVEGMVIGAMLGAMSAGAGAGVATAAVAARVSSQTPRFTAILAALRATTSGIAGSVRTTHAALQLRRARLERFLGVPLRTESGEFAVGAARWRPGWLARHEHSGSHTLERHSAKSIDELSHRLASSPRLRRASTFLDQAAAERLIAKVLRSQSRQIRSWLRSNNDDLVLRSRSSSVTGVGVDRSTGPQSLHGIRVVLVRDPAMPDGYRVLTAYPEP